MRLSSTSILACTMAICALPALAHHSFAMFDHEKTQTISGTVKEFEWTNPHAWIHIVAADEKGAPTDWSFEMGSVGQIAAQGWKSDTIKPGDKITVTMHPLKDGSHGGQYMNATLADGRSMRNAQDGANNNVPR
jgi:uncharacterized protein DUF6152